MPLRFESSERHARAALAAVCGLLLAAACEKRIEAGAQVYTCSMHPDVRAGATDLCPMCRMQLVPLASPPLQTDALTLVPAPALLQNCAIRTHRVEYGPLRRTFFAIGVLREGIPLVRDVTLKAKGVVTRVYADTVGMPIAIGDPLFEVRSEDLERAHRELLAARRASQLDAVGAGRDALRKLGLEAATLDALEASDEARPTITIRSPWAGTLLQKNVGVGAETGSDRSLLKLSEPASYWVDARIPEQGAPYATIEQPVQLRFDALPEVEWTGKIASIPTRIDEIAHSLRVRVSMPSGDPRLRIGMSVRLSFEMLLQERALRVPLDAVLDSGFQQTVFVALADHRFALRDVRVGRHGDDRIVEVLSGLEAGESVVVNGQILLDHELRLRRGRASDSQPAVPASRR